MACEILSSEIKEIIDYFLMNQAPLPKQNDINSVLVPNPMPTTENPVNAPDSPPHNLVESKSPEVPHLKINPEPIPPLSTEPKLVESQIITNNNINEEGPKGKYPLLEKLLSLFEIEKAENMNPVLAGYVSKVFLTIIDKRKVDLWHYFGNHKNHIDNFIRHCGNPSVTEVLQKMLDNLNQENADEIITKLKQDTIKLIAENLISTRCSEGAFEALYVLVKNRIELQYFLSNEITSLIFQSIPKQEKFIHNAVKLLKVLIGCNILPEKPKMPVQFFEPNKKDEELNAELAKLDFGPLLENAIKNFPYICENLCANKFKVFLKK